VLIFGDCKDRQQVAKSAPKPHKNYQACHEYLNTRKALGLQQMLKVNCFTALRWQPKHFIEYFFKQEVTSRDYLLFPRGRRR